MTLPIEGSGGWAVDLARRWSVALGPRRNAVRRNSHSCTLLVGAVANKHLTALSGRLRILKGGQPRAATATLRADELSSTADRCDHRLQSAARNGDAGGQIEWHRMAANGNECGARSPPQPTSPIDCH
uniref:Uncharacterized protein n=1 Tax=Plectus sambesii TaxID=2011161 RepID=A0A914WQN6_9BILA